MILFDKPYRSSRNSVIFPGFGWWIVAIVPWVVGVIEIVRWAL